MDSHQMWYLQIMYVTLVMARVTLPLNCGTSCLSVDRIQPQPAREIRDKFAIECCCH